MCVLELLVEFLILGVLFISSFVTVIQSILMKVFGMLEVLINRLLHKLNLYHCLTYLLLHLLLVLLEFTMLSLLFKESSEAFK